MISSDWENDAWGIYSMNYECTRIWSETEFTWYKYEDYNTHHLGPVEDDKITLCMWKLMLAYRQKSWINRRRNSKHEDSCMALPVWKCYIIICCGGDQSPDLNPIWGIVSCSAVENNKRAIVFWKNIFSSLPIFLCAGNTLYGQLLVLLLYLFTQLYLLLLHTCLWTRMKQLGIIRYLFLLGHTHSFL